jgi:hypothetical protein
LACAASGGYRELEPHGALDDEAAGDDRARPSSSAFT